MYKYHYVPFISDLGNFEISENFNELIDKKIIDTNSRPLSIYALSCLSFNDKAFDELLPKQFSKVKKALNTYFRDINKSKIDLNGEIFIRNGYILQPFITTKQLVDLNKTINDIYKDLKEKDRQLYSLKKSIIFLKNKKLVENEDGEFMINIVNSIKENSIRLNNNIDEMKNDFNYYLDNFSNVLFIDINKKYIPYIKDNEKSNFISKIKNIFYNYIDYSISKEEYDIDISFNNNLLEGEGNLNNMNFEMKKYKDIIYPRINYLNYDYNEKTTTQEFGKKYKFTKVTKAIKIKIFSKFTNINDNNKNEIIKNILNQKIILYGIPMEKIGITEGVNYNKHYFYLDDLETMKEIGLDQVIYTNNIRNSFLDYEKSNISIKIKDTIKVIKDKNNENINKIEIINNDNLIDGNLGIYIPIELTSLNIQKEDSIFKSLLNEINSMKLFYEKNCIENKPIINDIDLKFQCCILSSPMIIKVKANIKFEDVIKLLIIENKELENKVLVFLSNGQKIEKSKTVKENHLIENPNILIIANEIKKEEEISK